ncbi:hypothetical protein ACSXEK_15910 (plasmid) [Clostridium perfringens]|uniref:hypothetical protein n=1 Tax=Clostridium perfringens TaxID=1502 RepID=UPI00338DA518|nr:hypothetical protein [Clostridium perfringens]
MKLICDCGNEERFNTINEETGEENRVDEIEGQYSTIDSFNFWEAYDEVGIVCKKCGKAIWLFT